MKLNKSPLDITRENAVNDYRKIIDQAPPVSALLLLHLNRMFTAPELSPGDPELSQKLIYQHGIERVLKYLKGVHDKQENMEG